MRRYTLPILLACLSLVVPLGACSDDGFDPGSSDSGAPTDAVASPDGDPDGQVTTSDSAPPADASPTKAIWEQVASFGENPGNLEMFRFVPSAMPSGKRPLVVVLHPCDLGAETFAAYAGWHTLAEAKKVYLLFPQTTTANNPYICFNWFESGQSARGKGEAASIKAMIDHMQAKHPIDAAKIYISGMSAGGAMAANLLAAYPDVFSAGAIMAGIPAGCASSFFSAQGCMNGSDKSASVWRSRAESLYPGYSGPYPRLVLFHGAKDGVVSVDNLDELVEQWTALHGGDTTADISETVAGHPRKIYTGSLGNTVVTTYRIANMGHALPVDPGDSAKQGGKTGYGVFVDVDLWSLWYAAEAWGL